MFGLLITITGVYYSSYALINAMRKTNLKPNYYNDNTFYAIHKNVSSGSYKLKFHNATN